MHSLSNSQAGGKESGNQTHLNRMSNVASLSGTSIALVKPYIYSITADIVLGVVSVYGKYCHI